MHHHYLHTFLFLILYLIVEMSFFLVDCLSIWCPKGFWPERLDWESEFKGPNRFQCSTHSRNPLCNITDRCLLICFNTCSGKKHWYFTGQFISLLEDLPRSSFWHCTKLASLTSIHVFSFCPVKLHWLSPISSPVHIWAIYF